MSTTTVTIEHKEVFYVRSLIGETDVLDEDIAEMIAESLRSDGSLDLNYAVAKYWLQKATTYSDLVDVSESGSSRKMSALAENAMAMYRRFMGLSGRNPDTSAELPVEEGLLRRTTTRAIIRPSVDS